MIVYLLFYLSYIIYHILCNQAVNNNTAIIENSAIILRESIGSNTFSYMHFWNDWYNDEEAGDFVQQA